MKQLHLFNQKPILEVLKPIKQPTNESVCGDFYKELLKEPVYLEDCLGDLQDPKSGLVEKFKDWYFQRPIRCPICGKKAAKSDKVWFCVNPECTMYDKIFTKAEKPIRFQEKIQPSTPQKSKKNEKS